MIRLSSIEGDTSFLAAGEEEWVVATLNRPLITGDELWNDQKSQSALQMGNATLCLGEQSSLSILNLDDKTAQVKLSEGTLNLRVRRLPKNQVYEIDTPNLAFLVTRPGYYRITVDAKDDSTTVDVREGEGDAYGENKAYVMKANQAYRFTGTDLQNYEELELAPNDDLDEWCSKHLPKAQATSSKKYVSTEVIGYEDFDQYGTWEEVEEYGSVWRPSEVDADWAPYQSGHWAWIEPWGWTWIGDEVWGFAPYHYGRWASINDSWYWVPGPTNVYPVYAPALVAFIGGDGFQLSVVIGGSDIAWFPLGPGDIYWPSYNYSENYFSAINLGAPLINATLVAKAYRNQEYQNPYHNRLSRNAITAVPNKAFIGAENVSKARVKVSADKLTNAPITQKTTVKHEKESILGTTKKAKSKPTENISSRPVIAKSKVPTQKGDKSSQQIRSTAAGKPQALPKGKVRKSERKGVTSEESRKVRPSKIDQTPLEEIKQPKDQRLQRRQGEALPDSNIEKQERQRQRQEQRQQRRQQQQDQQQQDQQQRQQERQQRQQERQQQQEQQLQQLQQQQGQQQLQQLQQQQGQQQQNQQQRQQERQQQQQQQLQQLQQQQQQQLQQLQQQQQQPAAVQEDHKNKKK